MLKIDRSCSQRIITSALKHQNKPLLGLLDASCQQFSAFDDSDSLVAALAKQPDAIVVHNQNPDARSTINTMNLSPAQIVIEVREETKGVLGLLATRHGDHTEIPMEW